jgi:hypothetical protein
MLRGQEVPEFLWEYALMHAVYIRNCSFTAYLGDKTPYEGWYKSKPNVSHLREFGAPVWILLQGQKEDRKMLPKSKRQIYLGFDDRAKAVKYYNAETRKVLTSCNFRHITPSPPTPPEEVIIAPIPQHEGESGSSRDVPSMGADDLARQPNEQLLLGAEDLNQQPKMKKRKRREEPDIDVNAP